MNNKFTEAHEYVIKAREALRLGDVQSARRLGERAALLAPEMVDAWLVLSASAPDPQDALAYARKALELRPESVRARKGVEWASGRLNQVQASKARVATAGSNRNDDTVTGPLKRHAYQTAIPFPDLKSKGINWLYPVLLIVAGCMLFGFLALFALTSPALASIVTSVSAPAPTQEKLWAPVEIAKPVIASIDVNAFAAQAADTPTVVPTDLPPTSVPAEAPVSTPTEIPGEEPTASQIPEATETPGTMAMEIIPDTPTSEYIPPTSSPSKPEIASSGNGARWIDVDLSQQMVYAYEGDVVVNSFIVSTGVARTPTVTGKYKIWIKVRIQDMSGPGYYLRDVPYVMFFYKDYGFHGTYWHNNFGTPMSRGCVNLTIDDAAWLYNWSSVGTVVNVHY